MRPSARWTLVTAVAGLLVAAAVVPGRLPANASDVSPVDLRADIAASESLSWSGDVSSRGSLQVPEAASFGGIDKLLGETNDLRVWWVDDERWRVDRVRGTGETDLVREGDLLTRWVFESATATLTPYSDVRLPDASDLLPPELADRLLAGSTADELSSIPARRVAGRSAAGLRLTPADEQSTIRHVDVWADSSGLPLRVDVFAADERPVLTTEITRLDLERPDDATVSFRTPAGVTTRRTEAIDVAAGANAFAPFVLPEQLADLGRRGDPDELGAVGVYGRGPTALVAIPLRRGLAGQVREQLSTGDAEQTRAGTARSVGPLSVLLTPGRRDRGTFLLAGTVTPATLERAAADLESSVIVR